MTAVMDKRQQTLHALNSAIGLIVLTGFVILFTMYVGTIPSVLAKADAYSEIINNARFEGDIKRIEWIVRVADMIIVWVVSFIGFFIISAAMLRNVLAGAYCSYPRLFDKLAAMKQGLTAKAGGRGGAMLTLLAYIIPDVKELIDMEQLQTSTPRKYFINALLEGIVIVIIGVTIYNGLYRDLIVAGAGVGTHIIENYVLKVNFVREFDRILESGRMYNFIWEDSKEAGDKQRQEIARAVYLEVLRAYDTVRSTESRTAVGSAVESKLMEWFASAEPVSTGSVSGSPDFYFGHESYKFSQRVNWLEGAQPREMTNPPEGVVGFIENFQMRDFGVEGLAPTARADDYICIILQFRQVDMAGTKNVFGTVTLHTKDTGAAPTNSGSLSTGGPNFKEYIAGDPTGIANPAKLTMSGNVAFFTTSNENLSKYALAVKVGNSANSIAVALVLKNDDGTATFTNSNTENLKGTTWEFAPGIGVGAQEKGAISYGGQGLISIVFNGANAVLYEGQSAPFGTLPSDMVKAAANPSEDPQTQNQGTDNSKKTGLDGE